MTSARARSLALTALVLPLFSSSPARAADGEWTVDVGAGVPRLKSGDLKLAGDLTLGYAAEAWFLEVHGHVGWFDLETEALRSDNLRTGGSLGAGYLSGSHDSDLRFEARLAARVDYYDATDVVLSRGQDFTDQTSLFVGGSLLVGLRLFERGPLALRVLVGAGPQLESYSTLRVGSANTLADVERASLRPEARLSLRWTALPDLLSLRLRARGSRFEITRDSALVRFDPGQVATAASSTTLTQTEVSLRLFVDVDLLRFGGFVPSLFAGADWISTGDEDGSANALVPVGGLNLTRVADLL
jgi:hypothetical protein